jgi:hypothetical protein
MQMLGAPNQPLHAYKFDEAEYVPQPTERLPKPAALQAFVDGAGRDRTGDLLLAKRVGIMGTPREKAHEYRRWTRSAS